jgi:Flp pilus assembly protein TadG
MLRAFGRREDGNATIEFVFLFPLFMSIFLMGFESGYYMVRNVMLERAVDISVRDIRLGNGKVPQFAAVKEQICENAVIFPNCTDSIHVYMEEVAIAPGAIAAVTGEARCVNRFSTEPQFDDTDYNVGQANTMMVVQVCASVSPFFPTTGMGLGLQNDQLGGNMAIVATTAFVNEPGTRALAPYSPPMGSGGT